jgi:diaminohydroxyphosphoribosylaminopyrimidine deaminase / 5-amino-6-(5-phosphoribosylamino)uracil reductase
MHEKFMQRALDLASAGLGTTAPNPLVGAVIVHDGRIIGEGYHQVYGGPHAEVNAIASVRNPELLSEADLYVNLEPCAHYGKTPPCALLIIEKKIPRVIIGNIDPYSEVAGKGVAMLRRAGAEVITGVMEDECTALNKRFFTFHLKKRPFIILKWAQTLDGFIDRTGTDRPAWITNETARVLVHKWRTEESAILVGKVTALKDNPMLNVREWTGRNPVRIVIDRNLELDPSLNLFNASAPTIVFNEKTDQTIGNIRRIKLDRAENQLPAMLSMMYESGLQSVIVEGGARLLQSFIVQGLWDEARIFTGNKWFGKGVRAPELNGLIADITQIGDSTLTVLHPGSSQS